MRAQLAGVVVRSCSAAKCNIGVSLAGPATMHSFDFCLACLFLGVAQGDLFRVPNLVVQALDLDRTPFLGQADA